MSEYDETQLFPDMRLARILLERLGKNSLSVSVEVAAEKILEAQRALEDKDAEIARILAVEAAAKDAINQCFCIAPENTIKCECCKAEAETLKDFPHKPTCPVLVINPIGDKHD